ncbi:MAG: phytanoyl-CoA dioxygenase family protein [Steroidobacter sp.]
MQNALRVDDHRPPAACRIVGPSSHLDLLRSNGYVIFDRLISRETVDCISNELEPWFAATPRCRGDFYGWNTTRFGALLLKSPAIHALVLHELMLSIMEAVLGPHCDWHQLNLTQAVRIHPGERQQVPHRDEEMWPCVKNGAEYLVNVMWALSDFTAENGATMLWPRSQFNPLTREVDPAAAVVAEMPRGSALVYLGSVTHCGGANRSTLPRTGLILSYSLGWLKQYENAFLTYPPQVAKHFPREICDLLGYRIHRPNLGNYEGQDPAVLFETKSHALPAVDSISMATALELQAYYAAAADSERRVNEVRHS